MKLKTWAALQILISKSPNLNFHEIAKANGTSIYIEMERACRELIRVCGDDPNQIVYMDIQQRNDSIHGE